MLRLDATLSLLEAKLKSIDGGWELNERPGFDIARSADQDIPLNSFNLVNSHDTSGSGDPSRLEYSYYLISFLQRAIFAVCAVFIIYIYYVYTCQFVQPVKISFW